MEQPAANFNSGAEIAGLCERFAAKQGRFAQKKGGKIKAS
jgi:hypothetical protein